MKKLKILIDTMWYAAPGGQRALKAGDIVEISDPQLISSWTTIGVAALVE